MKENKIELIAVFKKGITEPVATSKLGAICQQYRTGMDSSRGKLYWQSTGPKFILTFSTEQERQAANTRLETLPEIHEVYEPDWDKCKD
jgi:hypothetical protein